jgi:hypothetical protein
MLKEGKTPDEIKGAITKKYMTDDVAFEKDYYDFINMLAKLKLSDGDEKEKD